MTEVHLTNLLSPIGLFDPLARKMLELLFVFESPINNHFKLLSKCCYKTCNLVYFGPNIP